MFRGMEEGTFDLTEEEARVVGCLLEKEATTPDAYPLSLNSLILACNQKTNRFPVVEYDEETVAEAVESLRSRRIVYRIDMAGSRVGKYRHNIDELLGLSGGGKALLAVLLLRGPQTLGELRTRSERMFSFASTEHVKDALNEIAEEVDIPIWEKMPRAPGQKEERFRQVLSALPEEVSAAAATSTEAPIAAVQSRNERVARLEAEVVALKEELIALKTEFESFKQQFE
jgi:uncharacterized protein YceH (UPF0502 family)